MQRARIRADSKTGWGVVAIALAAGLIAAAHVGELPPALPAIRAELGLDLISAAYLASLFSATGMLVAVFIGVLADRVNHWRLAVAGLTLMALSGFAGSFAGSGSQLLASRFLEGIGFLAVVVAAPSLIAETATGRDRQMALGLWPGYMPGGVSIAILLAPVLLAAGGWRGLWIALAAVSAGFAALMLIAGRTPSRVCTSANRGTGWTSFRGARASRAMADRRLLRAVWSAALRHYHLDADPHDRGARHQSCERRLSDRARRYDQRIIQYRRGLAAASWCRLVGDY